jgi:hypothetical protein
MNEDLKQLEQALKLSCRIRDRIIDECRISRATWWNWKGGKTEIPFWAKEKIDLIAQQELGRKVFCRQNEFEQNNTCTG